MLPTLGLAEQLELRSVDGRIEAGGAPFVFKGLVWWGAEADAGVPGGLDRRSLDDLLGLASGLGFNAIKLPFLHQHVLFDGPVSGEDFDQTLNPFLVGPSGRPVSYVEMLRIVARRAAHHGLLVWLVADSVKDLWYSRSIAEETVCSVLHVPICGHSSSRVRAPTSLWQVLDSWTTLTHRLCSQRNLVGVDLFNKPIGATWGRGLPTDWDVAAARLGNHINTRCPRWLIGVEGVAEEVGGEAAAALDPMDLFAKFYPESQDGECS